jgi:hypothetical protein
LDLLSIVPSLFSLVFNLLSISEKPSKIKFLEKFQKILFKILCQKWGREAPGTPQGDPPCHHTTWWCHQGQAAPWHGVGPPGPPLTSPPATSLSLLKYLHSIAHTRVLAVLAHVF